MLPSYYENNNNLRFKHWRLCPPIQRSSRTSGGKYHKHYSLSIVVFDKDQPSGANAAVAQRTRSAPGGCIDYNNTNSYISIVFLA
jgi:hypothetical protein